MVLGRLVPPHQLKMWLSWVRFGFVRFGLVSLKSVFDANTAVPFSQGAPYIW